MKVAVVLLTWKRLSAFQTTLKSFAKQTNKDFTLVISNANLTKQGIAVINKYSNIYDHKGLEVIVRHDGNEDYAFRRFYVGRDLYNLGFDVVLFVDDDVKIPNNYVEQCLSSYEPKTYKSGFAWIFYNRGRNYYKFRKRVFNNDHGVHYAGTGFCMIDASIFKDKALIEDAPEGSKKIEDLWLSFYVSQKRGWRVMYMETENVVLGGADSFALYKEVQKEKTDKASFLRTLVSMGWEIPAELPKELHNDKRRERKTTQKEAASESHEPKDIAFAELSKLRASGDLSNEEFRQLKRKLGR
jgi:glycosyltransferase involved in cell wall biosynthesis